MLDLAIPAVNDAAWGEEGWQYTPRLCAEVCFFHLKFFSLPTHLSQTYRCAMIFLQVSYKQKSNWVCSQRQKGELLTFNF